MHLPTSAGCVSLSVQSVGDHETVREASGVDWGRSGVRLSWLQLGGGGGGGGGVGGCERVVHLTIVLHFRVRS